MEEHPVEMSREKVEDSLKRWNSVLKAGAKAGNKIATAIILEAEETPVRPILAWFGGACTACGYPVVVTVSTASYMDNDYHWYCANKKCTHHSHGEETAGKVVPEWVVP